jgi:IclR family pca regulon transcriptional regulator
VLGKLVQKRRLRALSAASSATVMLMKKSDTGVASFEIGLAVLAAFDRESPQLTLVEIATRCGITRFAARRYLQTLLKLGLAATDGKHYYLTHRVLRMGSIYLSASPLVARVQPLLLQFTAETSESSYLWIQDGAQAIVVAKATPNKITNRSHSLGAHFPLFVTSAGLVIAAHQEPDALQRMLDAYQPHPYTKRTVLSVETLRGEIARVRKQGFAVSERQLDDLVRGIAVPIFDGAGNFIGAVSTNLFVATETGQASLNRLLDKLQRVASAFQGARNSPAKLELGPAGGLAGVR